jgi:hypothetical protein
MPDLFLITSVINTGGLGWSYTSTRSVYTPQERFEQTLKTIESVRKYMPGDTVIVIAEGSKLAQSMIDTLTDSVDVFLDLSDIKEVQDACLNTDKKGYGEVVKTRLAFEYIQTQNIAFDRMFKISGRYFLTDRFVIQNFSHSAFMFKMNADKTHGHTALYSVPWSLRDVFYAALLKTQERYSKGPISLENVLFLHCNPNKHIDVLGASGWVAVFSNDLWEG